MEDVRRYASELQCKGCYDVIDDHLEATYYKHGYCRECRITIPSYIPREQKIRFMEMRAKAKYG